MRLYVSSLVLAPTIASPLLQDRGSCPKTNLIASALRASSSASSWCSKYLSIATQTSTVTKTPPCSTVVVKKTLSCATKTVTTSAPLAYTTATVTETSTEIDTATITNVVTISTTETSTSTSPGILTITSACDPRGGDKVKRGVATPAALQRYDASCLSSACSCLSLPCAKTTVTKTAQGSTLKIISTVNAVVSTTVTVSPTTTITQTTTLATTTVTTTSTDSTVAITSTVTSVVPEATVTLESLSLQVVQSGTQADGLIAGTNVNGTLVVDYGAQGLENFLYDSTTGYVKDPRNGLVLSMDARFSYSAVISSSSSDVYASPLVCVESCGSALQCTAGTGTFASPVYFYLDGGLNYIYASIHDNLQGVSSLDLLVNPPI